MLRAKPRFVAILMIVETFCLSVRSAASSKVLLKIVNRSRNLINCSSGRSTTLLELASLMCERARLILHNPVELSVRESSMGLPSHECVIKNDNLREIVPNADFGLEREVDNLIMKCKEWFV